MVRNRWIVGFVLSTTLSSTLALNPHMTAFANVWTGSSAARIAVQGHTWGTMQTTTVAGRAYISFTTVQKLLQSYGIRASMTGTTLTLGNMPTLFPTARTWLNGSVVPNSATATLNGKAYVDITEIANRLSAAVNYQDGSKTLSVQYRTQALESTARHNIRAIKIRAIKSRAITLQAATTPTIKNPSAQVTTPAVASIRVVDDGRIVSNVRATSLHSTVYFQVGDLQQVLRHYGITSTWNGLVLSMTLLPRCVEHGNIRIGQDTEQAALLQVGQDWYIPAEVCSSLGLDVNVDALHNVKLQTMTAANSGTDGGTAANTGTPGMQTTIAGTLLDANGNPTAGQVFIEDPAGAYTEVAAQSDGRFRATVGTVGAVATASSGESSSHVLATVIGANTGADNWVGLGQDVTAGSASNLNVQAVQRFTTIHGHLNFSGAPFPVKEVSIRSVLTHVHYYAAVDTSGDFSATVPVGAYEVFALLTNGEPVYLLQPFDARDGQGVLSVQVDPLPTGKQTSTAHTVIQAGDKAVAPEDLLSVARIAEHVYPLDVANLGISSPRPIVITLYSTVDTYRQQFIADGYSPSEATQYAQNSAAVSEGTNDIRVCLEHFGEMDGLNLLAHEMTHALIANVSSDIPSWVNEGTAWHQGILAELDGSPSQLLEASLQWQEWEDIAQHQLDSTLQPLGQSGILDQNYNVEDQDYFAVEQLISEYGIGKLMRYINQIDHNANAFSTTFGQSFDTFSQSLTSQLNAAGKQTDAGFQVTIKVLNGGPSTIYINRPTGDRVVVNGLQAGQTYSIVCHTDGTVDLPSGVSQASARGLDVIEAKDWYIGVIGSSGTGRQEFEIANQLGEPILVRAMLYDDQGQVAHAYPATAIPAGLQLTDIKSLQ